MAARPAHASAGEQRRTAAEEEQVARWRAEHARAVDAGRKDKADRIERLLDAQYAARPAAESSPVSMAAG